MNRQTEYFQSKLDFELDPWDLFTSLEKGEDIIPLDTRKSEFYKEEHIPGAITLPHREMDETGTKDLDKSRTYACYCKGVGCNASTRGALKMSKLGFKVKELYGGLEAWKNDGYATDGNKGVAGQRVK